MTIRARIRSLARRSSRVRSAAAKVRSLGATESRLAASEGRLAAHEARLGSHDQAIGDLFPALQEVQGPRLSALDARVRLIEHHLPELLNTIASASGEKRLLRRTIGQAQADLLARMELIRSELAFELKYGQDRQASLPVEPKVVDEDKLTRARAEGLRVNLGCGHLPLAGYVNVDQRDLPGVDVICRADQLPLEQGEVIEIFSAHLVELFPQEHVERELLPYWVSLLRPGGELRTVVPDIGAMLAGYEEGTVTYAELRAVVFGGQEHQGDFHFNMYTVESFSELVAAAGLVEIEVEDRARRNGACFEFQIVGRKPV